MSRPAPYTTGDLLMDVELLLSTIEHCQRTGTTFDLESFKPQLRESGRRAAWRILDRSNLKRQIDEIGEQL